MIVENVKVRISKLSSVSSSIPGAEEDELVTSKPISGFFYDYRGKDIKMLDGVVAMHQRPVTFRLQVLAKRFYNELLLDTFVDLFDYLKDGYYVDVTHYKHPTTKSWVAYSESSVKRYQITYIERLDTLGDYLELSLKTID